MKITSSRFEIIENLSLMELSIIVSQSCNLLTLDHFYLFMKVLASIIFCTCRLINMPRASPNNGHTDNIQEEEEEFVHRPRQPVGIYGWRKRCLYAFILFLTVLTTLNLALIIWILRVLNFSVVRKCTM